MATEDDAVLSVEELGYVLSFTQYQDTLLQAYRGLHLTVQSILLAAGAGLFVAELALGELVQSGLLVFVLIAFFGSAIFLSRRFRSITQFRGLDVYFWQSLLLELEQFMPSMRRRYFSRFKIAQRVRSNPDDDVSWESLITSDEPLSLDYQRRLLMGKETTRQVLDTWLFRGLEFMWCVLLFFGVGYFVYLLILS